ncbi:hypothetical protein AB0C51_20075 [Streptomyces pathocidini]|uniref:hypothetical protein n=1 Tax=Streptomyces pathocidini TaxID=1650571 RepID=UPI0033FACD62
MDRADSCADFNTLNTLPLWWGFPNPALSDVLAAMTGGSALESNARTQLVVRGSGRALAVKE